MTSSKTLPITWIYFKGTVSPPPLRQACYIVSIGILLISLLEAQLSEKRQHARSLEFKLVTRSTEWIMTQSGLLEGKI